MNDTPIYNVKAASRITGLSPVTLRAWERRYGLPAPSRGTQGYRLYSEHDMQTLHWLKTQVETGLSISRAAQRLQELRAAGQDPSRTTQLKMEEPISAKNLSSQCVAALLRLDEHAATESLRTAFTLYPVDRALEEVIQPVLTEIGERWHRGELPIAVEHYATQFCLQHLMSMIATAGEPTRRGLIVAACAPGEHHEVGLLMIVLILRRRGWDVKYLGVNLPIEHLDQALAPLRPKAILFSATRTDAATALKPLSKIITSFPAPQPTVFLGGKGFMVNGKLKEIAPGIYVDGSPMKIVQQIESILQ